jgi:hypothetical protein
MSSLGLAAVRRFAALVALGALATAAPASPAAASAGGRTTVGPGSTGAGEATKPPAGATGETGLNGEGIEAPFLEGEEPEEAEVGGASAGASSAASVGENEVFAPSVGQASQVRLSSLKLARKSVAALAHRAVRASQVRFTFTISAPASVEVRLARGSARAGEVRWHTVADSLTLSAVRGSNHGRLHGANVLRAGEYRLRLSVTPSSSRAIIIRVD